MPQATGDNLSMLAKAIALLCFRCVTRRMRWAGGGVDEVEDVRSVYRWVQAGHILHEVARSACQWRTMATASASASAAPWQRHLKFMQPTQAEAVRQWGRQAVACSLLLSHMQMMFVDDPWKYSHTHTHINEHTHPVRHIQFNIPYTNSLSSSSSSSCGPSCSTPFYLFNKLGSLLSFDFYSFLAWQWRLLWILCDFACFIFFFSSPLFASLLHSSLLSFSFCRCVFLFIFSISLQRFRSPRIDKITCMRAMIVIQMWFQCSVSFCPCSSHPCPFPLSLCCLFA